MVSSNKLVMATLLPMKLRMDNQVANVCITNEASSSKTKRVGIKQKFIKDMYNSSLAYTNGDSSFSNKLLWYQTVITSSKRPRFFVCWQMCESIVYKSGGQYHICMAASVILNNRQKLSLKCITKIIIYGQSEREWPSWLDKSMKNWSGIWPIR
jgi:hypothetical protein